MFNLIVGEPSKFQFVGNMLKRDVADFEIENLMFFPTCQVRVSVPRFSQAASDPECQNKCQIECQNGMPDTVAARKNVRIDTRYNARKNVSIYARKYVRIDAR